MSRRRQGVRAVLHFVASVLMTSGALLLIDAALTVTWQEPVSAFLADRQQNALGSQLDRATKDFNMRELVPLSGLASRSDLRKAAAAWDERLTKGKAFGRLDLPTLHRHYVVVQGTDAGSLRKGPGHYPKTQLPGQGGTVAIAGHRTTYGAPFRSVNKLKAGQEIVLRMPYARFRYTIEKTQIVPPTALWITKKVPGRERLVLSACHPLYSAAKRIVVFARLRSVEPAG